MNTFNGKLFLMSLSTLLLVLASTVLPAVSSERSDEIKKNISGIEDADSLIAAVVAQRELKVEDPLERSVALEKSLQSKHPRVRSIGFRYLVETQKRLVVEATATESALKGIKKAGDKGSLLGALTLKFDFEDYDTNTSRFRVRCDPWGIGEGMIGMDGLTITINKNKLNLNSAISGYLIGTATYRLSNTRIPVELPAKAALP